MKEKQQIPSIQIKFWITVTLTAFYLCAVIAIASMKDVFNLSANELGDFFAGAFSPLAFGWFLYAVFMQNAELTETRHVTKMQAEQLSLQREELEGSRTALEDQSHALKRQNFENTFFNLIKSFNDIIDSIVERNGKVECRGREALHLINRSIVTLLSERPSKAKSKVDFEQDYQKHAHNLGHYFRLLNRIIKFVDQHPDLSQDEKKSYIKLLRSHLSNGELSLLLMNAYRKEENRMDNYILKYNLLDNLTIETLHRDTPLVRHAQKLNAKFKFIPKRSA